MVAPPDSQSPVFQEQRMERPQSFPIAGGEAAVYSARCPGKETSNEDGAILLATEETAGVLIVADGVGGMPLGDKTSHMVLTTLADQICNAELDREHRRAMIVDGIDKANLAARRLGGASTVCAVDIHHRTVRSIHVGDTVMMLVGGRGKIKFQGIPHSPTGYLQEMGAISEEEALDHAERHLISNVVGCESMRIEIGPLLRLSPLDTIVIASDGLWDNLLADEVAKLAVIRPLTAAVAAIADTALTRMVSGYQERPGKPDDLTIVAYRPAK